MSTPEPTKVTRILAELTDGDPDATKKLLPLVYEELRKLAHARMRNEPAGHTLQTTDLVHEAYLRLVGNKDPGWENCRHFFAAAAEAMRRILIERARRNARIKHGGGRRRRSLQDMEVADAKRPTEDILALDEALQKLEDQDDMRSEIVKLRYFAGLTIEQTAELLGVSPATVSGHWTFARAWLHREMMGRKEP